MTREEAKGNLIHAIRWNDMPKKEALEMAIKALEHETCDDAINREDTLKAMIEQLGIRNEDYLIPAEATLYKIVKNMPPVTPQPKIGHWIIVKALHDEWEGTKKYACDKCGEKVGVFKSKYCPNCGAKMVAQESEIRNER